MKTFKKDKLTAEIFPTREEMGAAAARDIAAAIRARLSAKAEINMIFAAAPSQNETLKYLIREPGIEWGRINALHMDEYIGLPKTSPACFGNYLSAHIFGLVPFKNVFCIDPEAESPKAECARYTAILQKYPPDIVVLGVGENGHIAFNDPGVADFHDPALVKVAVLDEVCRNQQVNDGCFASLAEVPEYALTLTVPALFGAADLFCSVPGATKARAIRELLTTDRVDEHCPATVMRKHEHAVLYCDEESAALLEI